MTWCSLLQVMSSLLSSATWEHPQCLDIMFVTSKRRGGELHAVLYLFSSLWHKTDSMLLITMRDFLLGTTNGLILMCFTFISIISGNWFSKKSIIGFIIKLLPPEVWKWIIQNRRDSLFILDWMEKINWPISSVLIAVGFERRDTLKAFRTALKISHKCSVFL